MTKPKPRRGRPPSKAPRTALLTIRVTPPELAQLNQVAEARGTSVAELLRPAIDRLLLTTV
jgi:hypothetical protein